MATAETAAELGDLVSSVVPAIYFVIRAIGDWLYHWQPLIAGLCAIIAAYIWGTSIIRASRASALSRSADNLKVAVPSPSQNSEIPNDPLDLRQSPPSPAKPGAEETVRQFRNLILSALQRIPSAERPLSKLQLEICREIGKYSLIELSPRYRPGLSVDFKALQSDQEALKGFGEGVSCTTAWSVLVSANRRARTIEEKL